jgi:hypothetical protein
MVNTGTEGGSMTGGASAPPVGDTYSKYGIEHIMYCMSLYPDDLAKLKEEDPDKHADVLHVRAMIGRSLARAMRS